MTRPVPPIDRFADKVALAETGCLLWQAGLNNKGYGSFRVGDQVMPAHRWIYLYHHGSIPEGWTVDHLCRVHACVMVDHLEAVTNQVNVLRGVRPAQLSLQRRPDPTRCGSGRHAWVESNVYTFPGGAQACRICREEHR